MKTGHILIAIAGTSVLGFIIYNNIQKKLPSPPIRFKKTLAKNYNALTIPPFGIYIKESEKDNQKLIAHEIVHWKQYQKMGLLNYYFSYFKQLKEYGYDNMPMEQEARKNESEYCRENYTECVRTGDASTVHNPIFRT